MGGFVVNDLIVRGAHDEQIRVAVPLLLGQSGIVARAVFTPPLDVAYLPGQNAVCRVENRGGATRCSPQCPV